MSDVAKVSNGGVEAYATLMKLVGAQNAPAATKSTLVADTALTILTADATRNGARVLNWTASPVYLTYGTTGTPVSGAPSDFIPAAVSGVPGQWECAFAPVAGLRAVGAAAGDLSVFAW